MEENKQLKHRLTMINDELKAFVEFLDENRMMEALEKPTKYGDSAWLHILNMEIACDLLSNESLDWKLYNSHKKTNMKNYTIRKKVLTVQKADIEAISEDEALEIALEHQFDGIEEVISTDYESDTPKEIEQIEGTKYARKCDECEKGMNEGYVINNGEEHYCSDECMHKHYTKKEWKKMHLNGDGDSYWTDYEDDHSDWQFIVKDGEVVDIEDVEEETDLSPIQLIERALVKMKDNTVGCWEGNLEDYVDAVILADFKGENEDSERITHKYNGWMEDIQKALDIMKYS